MASISKNIKDGKVVSFRIRAFLGRDSEGKQIMAHTTWHIPEGMKLSTAERKVVKVADAWELNQKEQYNSSVITIEKDKMSFTQFVNTIWIPLMVEGPEKKEKTINTYKYLSDKACAYFHDTDIKTITSLDLQKYIHFLQTDTNNKNKRPLSRKTIRHHYCVLSLIFGFAFDNEVIEKNPMLKVKAPSLERKSVDALTKEEARKFLFFIQECDLEFQCILLFMFTLGLRRGEVLGLQWGDIDFNNSIVSINRSVSYVSGIGTVVGTPKTENSTRVLPLPRMLYEVLCDYKNQERKEDDFVFPSNTSSRCPRDPDAITKRVKRFTDRVGLPDMSPHDLRHSCATLLLQSGADIKSVQEIMGHADASTTLKYYVRTDIDQMREATTSMESLFE